MFTAAHTPVNWLVVRSSLRSPAGSAHPSGMVPARLQPEKLSRSSVEGSGHPLAGTVPTSPPKSKFLHRMASPGSRPAQGEQACFKLPRAQSHAQQRSPARAAQCTAAQPSLHNIAQRSTAQRSTEIGGLFACKARAFSPLLTCQ